MSWDDHETCRQCGSRDCVGGLACLDRRDARNKAAKTTSLKIPSPQELIDARRVSCADRVRELTAKVVEDLRASPTYTARARDIPEVLDGVWRNLVGAGWKCETRKGGARDGGATDELRVYPPCASCGGRGSFTEDPNTGRGGGPCSRCHGNGYVTPVGET